MKTLYEISINIVITPTDFALQVRDNLYSRLLGLRPQCDVLTPPAGVAPNYVWQASSGCCQFPPAGVAPVLWCPA
jgi:hypothetical protein